DNWTTDTGTPVAAERVDLRLLFDDPDLVDAEPVAVYARPFKDWDKVQSPQGPAKPADALRLAGGQAYDGPAGTPVNGSPYPAPAPVRPRRPPLGKAPAPACA